MISNIAIYAGTFDPITKGHVDIVQRGLAIFDKVIVAVAKSERKSPFFPLDQRIAMAEAALGDHDRVDVKELPNLTIDFAKDNQAHYLIRGLRTAADFEYEAEIAEMNRRMSNGTMETVFLPTRPEFAFVSSSIVRELILIKAFDQLSQFLPEEVIALIN